MKNFPGQPTRIEDYRPAGNQFTLRGMFIFMTATSVIMAILALVIKEPENWLGALIVPLICFVIIAVMELGRLFFPPKPHFQYYLPPLPHNPLQTAYFGEGDSPFGSNRNYFGDNPGTTPFSPPPAISGDPESKQTTSPGITSSPPPSLSG